MEDRIARLEGRLEQIEGKLDRMTGLLERLLDDRPAALPSVAPQPEVAASLVRIAAMAPELEYVVHALASAPALVGEGVELAQSMAAHSGVDPDELQHRLFASGDLLLALTAPEQLAALTRLAEAAPVLAPGAAVLSGQDELPQRLAEALLRVSEPETLTAFTRIVSSAPQLEYVVHGLAAAPELLAEAADMLRGLSEAGVDMDARMRGGLAMLEAVSAPEMLQAIVTLSEVAVTVTRDGGARVASGVQLLMRLSEPETAATLERLVGHAGRLEPLLAGLAAHPRALSLLTELGAALDAAPAVSQPVGPLGLLAVMRDPEIQRTLGAALSVTRHMGRAMAPGQLPVAEAK